MPRREESGVPEWDRLSERKGEGVTPTERQRGVREAQEAFQACTFTASLLPRLASASKNLTEAKIEVLVEPLHFPVWDLEDVPLEATL